MNSLYTSSIMTSPVFAKITGRNLPPEERHINRNCVYFCADGDVDQVVDLGLMGSEAHMPREFGCFIRKHSFNTEAALRLITDNGTKEDYNTMIIGHSDCKYALFLIGQIHKNCQKTMHGLAQDYGFDFAKLTINCIQESQLPLPDLAIAVAGLLTFGAGNNLAGYEVVQKHHSKHGAGIVPMLEIFERGKYQGEHQFPAKNFYLYNPLEVGFQKVTKPDTWVERVATEVEGVRASLQMTVFSHARAFARKIAKSDTSLVIGA